MKVIEYKTINGQTPVNLDLKVNELLQQGYELFGPPYAVASSSVLTFFQAMVRTAPGDQATSHIGAV